MSTKLCIIPHKENRAANKVLRGVRFSESSRIFNSNTVKLSNSCTSNLNNLIKRQNAMILDVDIQKKEAKTISYITAEPKIKAL